MSSIKQLSELHGKKLARPIRTVYELLTNPARKDGSKIAVVSMHQPADLYSTIAKGTPTAEYLRWSFDEIVRVSHAMVVALAEAGIRPGMVIAVFVENNIESQILFRAGLELNCPIALLNPRSTSNHRELLHMFEVLRPGVVVVPNPGIAKIIDEVVPEAMKDVALKLICAGNDGSNHWQGLGVFLEASLTSNEAIAGLNIERKAEDVILIFFTSGTTSLPKGVPHTNNSWASILLGNPQGFGISDTSISCSHLPFFHSLGLAFLTYFNAHGCKSVIPAPTFNPKATLTAISLEDTNIFPSVPAMNSALLNHPGFEKSCAIDHIIIGTASVTPEYLTETVAAFGAKCISDGYGLTETGAIWFHRTGTKPLDTYPCPEIMVRVCDPETGEVLPRGVSGELHCGGLGVVSRYLLSKEQGDEPNRAFYDDSFGHWMRTGDYVVMDENGQIRVIGRYKDLIKRGGENLSPSLIELVLKEDLGIIAEVIGVPNEILGEVPVAIVKGSQKYDLSDVRGKLVERLGSLFALEDILTVESIGLDDFPRTHSGKTKKNVLREKAIEYLQARTPDGEEGHHVTAGLHVETLTALWSRHLGVSNLSPQQDLLDYADSLTLARFSAVLRKATGQSLSLLELVENPTIEEQAQVLLSQKLRQEQKVYSEMASKHDGPPTSNNMIHAMGDQDIYDRTKTLSEQVLSPLGLSWDDVEDIVPMHGTLRRLLERRRPQSNNHRHTWLCRGKSVQDLEGALEKSLAHHSILRAMCIHYDPETPMHVILRPSERLFPHILTHAPPVKNTEELWRQSYNSQDDWAADPGPLFRLTLAFVEQQNCAGMVYMGQHSTFDAISFEMFLEDLDTLLVSPETALMPRVPYKAWADSYYNLQYSATAQHSIAWQVQRLRGISNHKSSLFPQQRAPEWFKGQSDGWVSLPDGKPGPARRALDGGVTDGAIGAVQSVKMPGAKSLKLGHGIEVPSIAKAALAIISTRRTKSSVALFGQYQAGRTWPFLPGWQTRSLPDAMNIAGPTVQSTAVMVGVSSTDTIGEMLLKLQEEQSGINTYSHAPYDQLIDRLNEGDSEDGDVVVEIIRRQIFNWLPPSLAIHYKSLQRVHLVSRADVGILWNCSMVDEETLQVAMSWDDAQLSGKEALELLQELLVVIEQVSKAENWERTVGELSYALPL